MNDRRRTIFSERIEASESEFVQLIEETERQPSPAQERMRWQVIYSRTLTPEEVKQLDEAWELMRARRKPDYQHLKIFWRGNKRITYVGVATGNVWRELYGGHVEYKPVNRRRGTLLDVTIVCGWPGLLDDWEQLIEQLTTRFRLKSKGGPKETPIATRIKIVMEWRKISEEPSHKPQHQFADSKYISVRTLQQWQKDLEKQGLIPKR